MTRSAGNDLSTSITKTSWTPSSSMLNVRNRCLPYNVSLMKSTDHTTFGCGITSSGWTTRDVSPENDGRLKRE
jgi:hypothetical protein